MTNNNNKNFRKLLSNKNIILLVLILLIAISFISLSYNRPHFICNKSPTINSNSFSMFNESQKVSLIYGLEGSLNYEGSNSYDNQTNTWYTNDSAYVKLDEIYGDTITYWTFDYSQTYINLSNLYINIYGLSSSHDKIRLDVYNASSDSWITIGQVDFSSSSYSWENFTYSNFNEKILIDGNRLILRFYEMTLLGNNWWKIDFIDCTIEGYTDIVKPIISDLSIYPSNTKYPNTTITVNCTTFDIDSEIESVYYFYNGDINLTENLTINQYVPKVSGNTYTHDIKLPAGNWTVTAIVTDIYENINNQTKMFEIEEVPCPSPNIFPSIFFSVNITSIPIGDTAQFTIYVHNASHNLSDVWIYDGILNSNITIDSNINEKTNKQYLYNISGNILGFYDFIFYVNDTNNNLSFFNWSNTFEIILPDYYPIINDIIVNNSYLGINHFAQINFSVKSEDWNLDDVWIYNPITVTNDTITQNINDKDWHNFSYDTASNISGSYIFKIYANNSRNSYSRCSSEITIITWIILRNQNLPQYTYLSVNDSYLPIDKTAQIKYNVSAGEYNLSKTWIYDPVLNQNITIADINTEGVFQFTYNTTSSTSSSYKYIIYTNDTYNNIISINTEIIFAVSVGPNLCVQPSSFNLQTGDNLTLYITIESTEYPIDSVWIKFDNQTIIIESNINHTGELNLTYSYITNTQKVTDFKIYINDTKGNTNSMSVPISFEYIMPPTQIFFLQIQLVMKVVAVGLLVGLLLYLPKRLYLKQKHEKVAEMDFKSFYSIKQKVRILHYTAGGVCYIVSTLIMNFSIYFIIESYISSIFTPITFGLIYSLVIITIIYIFDDWKWIFATITTIGIILLFYNIIAAIGIFISMILIILFLLILYLTSGSHMKKDVSALSI
ncbi:MAG: hypothetical protein GF317_06005 [Candidatus Lokiarchaeota archaeon]|nr:hypothetical protein [Candidatus Lokiarchaeota archaeon]